MRIFSKALNSVHKSRTAFGVSLAIVVSSFSGYVSAVQSEKTHTVATRYNMVGQVTGVIQPDPDGTGPLNHLAVRNTYDSRGLLILAESGELTTWQNETVKPKDWTGFTLQAEQEYTYDSNGQNTSVASKDSGGSIITYSQKSYDDYYRLECEVVRVNETLFGTLTTDACTPTKSVLYGYDRVTKYTYDDIGQVLIVYKAFGTTLEQAYVTNEYYDDEGKPGLLKSVTDANTNKTTLEYDAYARLEKRIYPDSRFNHYVYDINSNMIQETKRNGAVIDYVYDDNNRMVMKNYVDNSVIPDANYTYDLRGLTLSTTSGLYGDKRWVNNTFDGFGNLKSTITAKGYYPTEEIRSLEYEYDSHNNRIAIIHPDGKRFSYDFDGLDRVASLSDPSATLLMEVDYTGNGQRDALTRNGAAGAITEYFYDDIGRLEQFSQGFSNSFNDLTSTLVYSPSNDIESSELSNTMYQYEGNNNITGSYAVNNLNQYTKIDGKTLGYDNNGNLIDDGDGYTYTYDDENRLVEVGGLNTGNFEYDPLGRLYKSTINEVVTEFLYDGDALVAEYSDTGALLKRYIHGDQVDEPWIQFVGAETSLDVAEYLHADQLGSIIAHSDKDSIVNIVNSYDTYGIPADSNIGRFLYTGQIGFSNLGLYFYKARFYHPRIGRFLQTDPIFYEDQMNMYAYVHNNPYKYVDPDGQSARVITGFYRFSTKAYKYRNMSGGLKRAISEVGAEIGHDWDELGTDSDASASEMAGAASDLILGTSFNESAEGAQGADDSKGAEDANDKYTGHGEDPEGKTGKGSKWQKHSEKRAGKRYGVKKNNNRGNKNKKYKTPKNPNQKKQKKQKK